MAHDYGVRYLKVQQFVRYCASLNVKTDLREIEHYEKTGIMLPIARVVYPDDYAALRTLWPLDPANEQPKLEKWPELSRLFEQPRFLPQHYANLPDEELIDSFDREMGKNPYLIRPALDTYKPWNSYEVVVPYRDNQQLTGSTADHYYSYWQVYQLHLIHQYPDLYANRTLLNHIPEEVRRRLFRPWAPDQDVLRDFKGMAHLFDALSFWITVDHREHNRTFALVPEEHQVKRLNMSQLQAYRDRLISDAKLVKERFSLTANDLYRFLRQLLELYDEYRRNEHYKLSEEIQNDIFYQTQFIEASTGLDWEEVIEELGKRYTPSTRQRFRHLNTAIKERDEAQELLTFYSGKYSETLAELKILGPTRTFPTSDIDGLMNYCEHEGLSVLLTALSGMIATEDEYTGKFRRVTRYTNLKNALTAVEFLLKDLAGKGHLTIAPRRGLRAIVEEVMKNEVNWFSVFKAKKDLASADDSVGFFNNLNQLLHDVDLVQSEDVYWARVFLITCLARNLTVHTYPDDDWFYGDLFGEMLRATIYAILYSWQVAKREGWV